MVDSSVGRLRAPMAARLTAVRRAIPAGPPSAAAAGRRPWPLLLAGVVAVVFLIHLPSTPDLAAQTSWAQLAGRVGFVPIFARWFGGVPTGGYSLLSPSLMAAVGVHVAAALLVVATCLLAARLFRDAAHPRLGTLFATLSASFNLFSGRTTFALGLAVGVAAMLAAQRRHPWLAVLGGVGAAAASPVAGLFVLVPAATWLLTDPSRRRSALGLGLGAGGMLVVLQWAFPLGGYEPFSAGMLAGSLVLPAVGMLLPVGRRVRVGLLLVAALLVLAFVVHTPLGSNASRLALLAVAPAVAATCRFPHRVVAVLAAGLAAYSLGTTIGDVVTAGDPSSSPAYTAALVTRLADDPLTRTQRVEVVEPRTHWATARLTGAGVTVARGWVTQVDELDNPEFYGRAPLTAASYRAFLDRTGAGLVALPHGTPLATGAVAEAALVRGGLPYLQEVWADHDWAVYRVADPAPLATGPARVEGLTDVGMDLTATGPGTVHVLLHYSPYLRAGAGDRVVRAPDGTTDVQVRAAGPVRLAGTWRWP